MTRMGTRRSTRLSKAQSVHKNYEDTEESSDSEYEELIKFKREFKQPRTPTKKKLETPKDIHVTPPKQFKTNIVSSPTTPSSLLKDLSLTSPTKKSRSKATRKSLFDSKKPEIKHDVDAKVAPKKLTDKENSLSDESDSSSDDDNKTEHKRSDKRQSVYQSAKKALHSARPVEMPGREKEQEELLTFINTNIENKSSASLYISGPPGTGKTALLNLLLEDKKIKSKTKQIYINCTTIKSAATVYSRICKDLSLNTECSKTDDYLIALEKHLKRTHKTIILVLDEIDQLSTKNQSILYTIFEWPSKPHTNLILIGIANALDLTDRTLPRLQARCELKPRLMHFAPYTKQQIVDIITSRLKLCGVLSVFSPVALQMLAGKVASISGDVRKALDIARRVIEQVDQSNSKEILKSVENMVDDLVKNKSESTLQSVGLTQVVNVLNNVYGTSQNISNESDESFPLQQKIVICCLLLILKKSKNKDITIGKLHDIYRKVCKKRNIPSVDQAEFVGLCSLIETRGIIRVSGKKEARLHKVCLEWDEEEVGVAMKDKQLISSILQDDSDLGKL